MLRLVLVMLALFGLSAERCSLWKFANPSYVPNVPSPRYSAGKGPQVWFDEAHRNVHTLSDRFRPFAQLLEADGYVVEALTVPLDRAQLGGALLALVLPQIPYSQAEQTALLSYVGAGGGLLLITDHPSHPVMIESLLASMGILTMNVTALHVPQYDFDFVHFPRGPVSSVPYVKSYHGSVLSGLGTPVLKFGWTAVAQETGESLNGTSRGAVIEHGSGRVYVSTDAQMFTSQCWLDCSQNLTGFGDIGAVHNEQFVLDVMHWLESG